MGGGMGGMGGGMGGMGGMMSVPVTDPAQAGNAADAFSQKKQLIEGAPSSLNDPSLPGPA